MNLLYFNKSEFDCSHTGKNEMKDGFLLRLDELRAFTGLPFKITSGYRDPSHPVEAAKETPGRHSEGIAADIAVVNGYQRGLIVKNAISMGFSGIGVAKTFVHVDDRGGPLVIWGY